MCCWRSRSWGSVCGSSSRRLRFPGWCPRCEASQVTGARQTAVTMRRRRPMTSHKSGTREEWLAARLELLDAEKELTRRSDDVARQRQELPWVRIDKDYRFETDEGSASLADLFRGRSQLLVYHFMFGPDYTAGCPACSAIADGFNGVAIHLANHDTMLWVVSRAPLAKLQGYKQRMGWSFPWASSFGSDFNPDFDVALTEEQERAGAFEYNFRESPVWSPPEDIRGPFDAWAATTGDRKSTRLNSSHTVISYAVFC